LAGAFRIAQLAVALGCSHVFRVQACVPAHGGFRCQEPIGRNQPDPLGLDIGALCP
jgi:hypothetical protein